MGNKRAVVVVTKLEAGSCILAEQRNAFVMRAIAYAGSTTYAGGVRSIAERRIGAKGVPGQVRQRI